MQQTIQKTNMLSLCLQAELSLSLLPILYHKKIIPVQAESLHNPEEKDSLVCTGTDAAGGSPQNALRVYGTSRGARAWFASIFTQYSLEGPFVGMLMLMFSSEFHYVVGSKVDNLFHHELCYNVSSKYLYIRSFAPREENCLPTTSVKRAKTLLLICVRSSKIDKLRKSRPHFSN